MFGCTPPSFQAPARRSRLLRGLGVVGLMFLRRRQKNRTPAGVFSAGTCFTITLRHFAEVFSSSPMRWRSCNSPSTLSRRHFSFEFSYRLPQITQGLRSLPDGHSRRSLHICSSICALFLRLGMPGTAAMAVACARHCPLQQPPSQGGQLPSKHLVNFVQNGWSTSDPIDHLRRVRLCLDAARRSYSLWPILLQRTPSARENENQTTTARPITPSRAIGPVKRLSIELSRLSPITKT